MQKNVGEIAKFLGGELIGDPDLVIKGLSGVGEAQPGDLTFIANPKYFPLIDKTKATAIICPLTMTALGRVLIRVENPSLAFAKAVTLFLGEPVPLCQGIHPTAIISPAAKLGKGVAVGPYAVIEKGACLGERSIVGSNSYIGYDVTVGADCLVYPNVVIREQSVLGNRVVVHSGTVIGADGFGYVNVDGRHQKIPQVGIVEIQDDVEIGANVTVDRARFDKTVIGSGTKIDNLVQIAHNVRIGKNCIIISQVGISGSSVLEDNVILAGQVGLAGHLTIGAGAVVAAKSGVSNSIAAGEVYWGYPAKPQQEARRVNACVQRLPHYVQIILDLKKKVEELERAFKAKGD
jgi:UDP-3-O-[3-hydroxymyristoyl] glucosamine N-acyltransferase